MAKNYGSKRVVVGAHYGLRDWLAQRVTAGLMALFTIVLLLQTIFGGPLGYDHWAGIFSAQWMKFVAVRLVLQVFTIVWLVGCAGWAIQVLWRL
jgi:succinate dehydrogenase / fumarate reductase membrane anchor subunit